MFGNCPRKVWEMWCPPDGQNRIDLASRALLVQTEGQNVLLEAGIGAFFEPRLRQRYGVLEPEHTLLASLQAVGLTHDQIDVVVLSHLHFDHAGGLLEAWKEGVSTRLLFPNATFVVGREAWERAIHPHPRDRASFVPELNALLEASGRLELIDGPTCTVLPSDRVTFTFSSGHTPGMTMARVATPRGPITFVGDLIPGVPWIHLPITMGYDRSPELLVDEKRELLGRVIKEQGWLFFTHDPRVSACRVTQDEGRYRATESEGAVRWG